ncbi:MAG: bifunctional 2-polyprenyl-6-hydroxyphenol methylase/3-demethylubiquinol 3-O-methyltransferase UbiG [Zoogloeaceae bacterium]|jgi:2-polyprenyl-6-hydroxyphenyl methylase/3-demethylubiquinone-9 3-methyltransferase|nr:bifunctional 2-polyprenyl-6-hydroxyphenol methylase/3-demethylubiquinol 3-O-methyltransferase UbiG [Zoogloeaceae bacterium]
MTETSPQAINADPEELAKFSELAHLWWDVNSEFKPLHEINPLRLDWIEQEMPLAGKTALDIGCGGGLLSEGMAARGARVTGIDLAEKSLGVARLHLLESGLSVDYRQTSAEALADELPAAFDLVTCLEILEHVPDPASIVRATARLVKPGGKVFFSTLNRNPKSYLFAIVGAEYLLRLLPQGTHNYNRFITPSELSRWCRDAALMPLAPVGLSYQPLTRSYSLSHDVSVNYLLAANRPA